MLNSEKEEPHELFRLPKVVSEQEKSSWRWPIRPPNFSKRRLEAAKENTAWTKEAAKASPAKRILEIIGVQALDLRAFVIPW